MNEDSADHTFTIDGTEIDVTIPAGETFDGEPVSPVAREPDARRARRVYPSAVHRQEGQMRKLMTVVVAALLLGLTACKGGADAAAELGLTEDGGATGATGAVPTDCADQTGGPATITMVDFAFDPSCVQVSASESLTLVNEDDSAHRFILEGGAVDETLDAGETVTVKSLSAVPPGTYSFSCGFHPPMKGTLVVG